MSQKAKQMNQIDSQALAARGESEDRVAVHDAGRAGWTTFDMACLADEHYAVSEKMVDQCRATYEGNWILDNDQQFLNQHGSLIEAATTGEDSEDEAEPRESHCQAKFCPGICAKDVAAVQRRFDLLKGQCVALLRYLRSVRREQGFVPKHGLLMVKHAGSDIPELHLMARVAFSPFDFTAVELKPKLDSDGVLLADIQMLGGTAVMRPMAQLLLELAGRAAITLHSAEYKTLSLGSIMVVGSSEQALISLQDAGLAGNRQQEDAAGSSGSEDEAMLMLEKRASLLKRAMGVGRRQAGQQGQKTKRQPGAARQASSDRRAIKQAPATADSQHEQAIAEEWASMTEHRLGDGARSSSSSSSSAPNAAANVQPARPQQFRPWKDDNGHRLSEVESRYL